MTANTDDLRITGTQALREPDELIAALPVTEKSAATVTEARQAVSAMLSGKDDRIAVVVGPC